MGILAHVLTKILRLFLKKIIIIKNRLNSNYSKSGCPNGDQCFQNLQSINLHNKNENERDKNDLRLSFHL